MSFMKSTFAAIAIITATAAVSIPAATAQATSVGVIDYNKIRADSRAGQNITTQLNSLRTELGTELSPVETAYQTASEAFAAKFEGLSPEERASKVQADETLQQEMMELAQGEQAVATNTQLATLVMQATAEKAWSDFDVVLMPVIEQVAGENGIEVILARGQVVYVDSGKDLSAKVVAKLNTTTTTIPVVRQQIVVDQNGQVRGTKSPD